MTSFDEAWNALDVHDSPLEVEGTSTVYEVTARTTQDGRRFICAEPRRGEVRIYEEDWQKRHTAQGTFVNKKIYVALDRFVSAQEPS